MRTSKLSLIITVPFVAFTGIVFAVNGNFGAIEWLSWILLSIIVIIGSSTIIEAQLYLLSKIFKRLFHGKDKNKK